MSSYFCDETVVVAGVLPVPTHQQTSGDKSSKSRHEITMIRNFLDETRGLIRKIREDCCCRCCSCRPSSSSSSTIGKANANSGADDTFVPLCGGCTRRVCWDDLDVVGCYCYLDGDPNINNSPAPSTREALKNIGLPMFTTIGGGKLPWWALDDGGAPEEDKESPETEFGRIQQQERQLLLYDGVGRNGFSCLYRCQPFRSYFDRTFLTRLVHANAIVEILLRDGHDDDDQLLSINGTGSRRLNQNDPCRATASSAAGKEKSPTKMLGKAAENEYVWPSYILSYLRTRSLLFDCICSRNESVEPTSCFPLIRAISMIVRRSTLSDQLSVAQSKSGKCNLCKHHTVMPLTQYEIALERKDKTDSLLSAAVDGLLGLVVLVVVALSLRIPKAGDSPSFSEVASLEDSIARAHFSSLRDNIRWLETFPIGFKLNELLTANMGRDIAHFLDAVEWALAGLAIAVLSVRPVISLVTMSSAAIALGGLAMLALAFDLFQIFIIHIHLLATCFRYIYAAELYLLRALWRLFRGKKKNVLRNRTDTMEYDSMQLLFGTILFAVALFLFTTIFVYQIFFSVVEVCYFAIAPLPILILYMTLTRFPYGVLVERWRYHSFIDEVYLLEEKYFNDRHPGNEFDVSHLKTRERSYASIFQYAYSSFISEMAIWVLSTLTGLFFGFKLSRKTLFKLAHGQ